MGPLKAVVWAKKSGEAWEAMFGDVLVGYVSLQREHPLLGKWQASTRRPFENGLWVSNHPDFQEARESVESRITESFLPFLHVSQVTRHLLAPMTTPSFQRAVEASCTCGHHAAAQTADKLAITIDEKRTQGNVRLSEQLASEVQAALEDSVQAHRMACGCAPTYIVGAEAHEVIDDPLAAALAWWREQGQFLRPQDGDHAAWDAYHREPVPAWTVGVVVRCNTCGRSPGECGCVIDMDRKDTCPACGLDQSHAPISQECGDFHLPAEG